MGNAGYIYIYIYIYIINRSTAMVFAGWGHMLSNPEDCYA